MAQTFTQDHLLQFIYKETTTQRSNEIRLAISESAELKSQYLQLLAAVRELDTIDLEPHATSVKLILEHAASQKALGEHH